MSLLKAGYIFTNFPFKTRSNEINYLKCTSFIIIDKIYGSMLFDTGSPYDHESFIEQLKTYFNITPDDIKWIFITHIHPDHLGCTKYFKNAKLILSENDYIFQSNVNKVITEKKDLLSYIHINCPGYKNNFKEFEANNMKKYFRECWSEEQNGLLLEHQFIEDNPLIPEIISIIPTPGHTFYHYSYVITYSSIKIMITGDSLSIKYIIMEDNKNERFLEPHMDFKQYFKSLQIIKKFDGIIVPGHDRPFKSKALKSYRKNIITDYPDLKRFIS